MTTHLDVALFVRTSGNRALLAIVGQAFLDQLPGWRHDVDAASQRDDRPALGDLLHKMKGGCYAVAANPAALAFDAAERALPTMTRAAWTATSAMLLSLLARIELELIVHTASAADATAASRTSSVQKAEL